MKLLTVIGARPQIIKAAAFSRAVKSYNDGHADGRVVEKILHTGQHYDANMSQVFFDELGIPAPDYNLGVGSGSHGVQTARIIEGIEAVLTGRMPSAQGECNAQWDGVVLYGDTNSTLAGAVAASKLHVPIFHVEAGLRSYNMAMPEEINRIVCDQLSTILFAPTQTAVANLEREGFGASDPVGRRVVLSGDVMYDNSIYFSAMAERKSDIIERLGLHDGGYVLATIHRPANTDSPQRLSEIFRALADIAASDGIRVVLPLHPRTAKLLQTNLDSNLRRRLDSLTIIPPASFFEIIRLERHAAIVMTDSGGVQKEAFFFGKPTVILRPETEWVEIVRHGAGILADADYGRITAAFGSLSGRQVEFPALFGDARAAEHVLHCILQEND